MVIFFYSQAYDQKQGRLIFLDDLNTLLFFEDTDVVGLSLYIKSQRGMVFRRRSILLKNYNIFELVVGVGMGFSAITSRCLLDTPV